MTTYSVYYMKPEFFRDGIMGASYLAKLAKLPKPGALDRTHVFLRHIEADNLESVFVLMQGENWSPRSEARDLIEAKGLQHTSMSVGDIAVNHDTWDAYLVDRFGFTKLT